MQEILLMGNSERAQDEHKMKIVATQLLYAMVESDPVDFIGLQLLYAVQEEVV